MIGNHHLSMRGFVLLTTLILCGGGMWKTRTTSVFVNSFPINTHPIVHYNHRHVPTGNSQQQKHQDIDYTKSSTTTNTRKTQLFLHNHQRNHHTDPMVTSIRSEKELLDFLSHHENENDLQEEAHNLRVVKVYADWCKTCRVFDLKFRKLAKSTTASSSNNHIRFGEIEFSTNEALCRSLGATKFPYIMIYKSSPTLITTSSGSSLAVVSKGSGGATTLTSALPLDTLTEFRCGPSTFHRVVDAIQRYSSNNDIAVQKQNIHDVTMAQPESTTSHPHALFDRTMREGSSLVQHIMTTLSQTNESEEEESQTDNSSAASASAHATPLSTTLPIETNANPMTQSSFEDFCKSQSSS